MNNRTAKPLVSVLLPVFNATSTLERAMRSIRRQTFADWELVVVDDGSTDGSADLAASFRDTRIRLVRGPHRGVTATVNHGISVAEGELIVRMDADDESHPQRLERQVAYLIDHPDIGLVGSLVRFGGDSVRQRGYSLHVDWLNGLRTPDHLALNRFVEMPFAHPSVACRRELFDRLGGYREGAFPEDYELILRWLDAGVRMAKVPEVLLTWNDSPSRLSRTDPRYSSEAFYRCKAVYLARWLVRGVPSDRPILVWGAGRLTRKRAEHVAREGLRIAGYIDIDPRKIGRVVRSRPVISPEELPAPGKAFVLGYVGKRGAREMIRDDLAGRGYVEGRDFLMAA